MIPPLQTMAPRFQANAQNQKMGLLGKVALAGALALGTISGCATKDRTTFKSEFDAHLYKISTNASYSDLCPVLDGMSSFKGPDSQISKLVTTYIQKRGSAYESEYRQLHTIAGNIQDTTLKQNLKRYLILAESLRNNPHQQTPEHLTEYFQLEEKLP